MSTTPTTLKQHPECDICIRASYEYKKQQANRMDCLVCGYVLPMNRIYAVSRLIASLWKIRQIISPMHPSFPESTSDFLKLLDRMEAEIPSFQERSRLFRFTTTTGPLYSFLIRSGFDWVEALTRLYRFGYPWDIPWNGFDITSTNDLSALTTTQNRESVWSYIFRYDNDLSKIRRFYNQVQIPFDLLHERNHPSKHIVPSIYLRIRSNHLVNHDGYLDTMKRQQKNTFLLKMVSECGANPAAHDHEDPPLGVVDTDKNKVDSKKDDQDGVDDEEDDNIDEELHNQWIMSLKVGDCVWVLDDRHFQLRYWYRAKIVDRKNIHYAYHSTWLVQYLAPSANNTEEIGIDVAARRIRPLRSFDDESKWIYNPYMSVLPEQSGMYWDFDHTIMQRGYHEYHKKRQDVSRMMNDLTSVSVSVCLIILDYAPLIYE